MSEILASVLSSGVVAAVITKLSNDHDRKKNYLIEEAKERRNELRNVSRKLGNVEKYDKDTQYILRDLKLCLNAYGNYSSNGDKNDLLRDAHIWQEMEMLEKECEEQIDKDRQKLCFEKHKEKLLQYIGYLIEYQTEMIKKEATTCYYNVFFIVSLFLPLIFAFWGAWEKNIRLDMRDILYPTVILIMTCFILQFPIFMEKLCIPISNFLCKCCWGIGVVFYAAVFCVVCYQNDLLLSDFETYIFIAIIFLCAMVIFMYVSKTRIENLYKKAVARIMGYDILWIMCPNKYINFLCSRENTKKINFKIKTIDAKEDESEVIKQIHCSDIEGKAFIKFLGKNKYNNRDNKDKKEVDPVKTWLEQNLQYCRSFATYDGKTYIGIKQIKKLLKTL